MIYIELLFSVLVSFVIANVVAKAYVVTSLQDIEMRPRMYGEAREIEVMYIHTVIVFSGLDLIRRFVLRKPPLKWLDWHNFLQKKLNKKPSNSSYLDYQTIKLFDLVDLLQQFRKENF